MTTANEKTPIEIGQEDLAAMAAAWKGTLNPLSPLPRNIAQDAPTKTLQQGVENNLEILAEPTAVSGVAAVMNDRVMDLMIYHDLSNHSTAIINTQGKLWLQNPAPIQEILKLLAHGMPVGKSELPHIDQVFSLYEMYLLWAMLDIVRRRPAEETTSRVTITALREMMDQPFAGMKNLAAYYRDCLLLPLPNDQELDTASRSLMEREWIGKVGKDLIPGDPLLVIADGFSSVTWHVLARAAKLMGSDSLDSIQVRLMRSIEGLGFIWYESGGKVNLISADRAGLLNMVNQILSNPATFFVNGKV